MNNGCVDNGGYFYTMDECSTTWLNGMLKDGLQVSAAVRQSRMISPLTVSDSSLMFS